jgi:hypothetical protein
MNEKKLNKIIYLCNKKYLLSYGPLKQNVITTSIMICIQTPNSKDYEPLLHPSEEQFNEIIHALMNGLCAYQYPSIP